ncbi:hypothetical protein [Lutimonas sp.]|uniref:hypothetical protein n=1 Tax=Lutimonas sp. TaxID=1872403 RepID=UPI003C7537E6
MNQIVIDLKIERFILRISYAQSLPASGMAGWFDFMRYNIVALKHFSIVVL